MIGPVVQLHLEVDDGIASHGTARRGFLDAALHRRDVLPRDDAAHDLVQELEPRSPRQGRDPDPAVAVLAAAARLLLVLPLSLRPRLEGLAVGDLRLPDHGVHPELAGQPTDDDLEVALPQPADQRLPQLPRILVLERRILLVQLVQPVRELFLFAALLHFDRLGDHRLGEGDLGEHDRVVLGRERVVGVRVSQFGHDADVPRVQLGDFDPILPHRHAEVVQLFDCLTRRVVDVLAVLDGPRVHSEKRHVAHMRLGDRLEHLRHEPPRALGLQRHPLRAPPPLRFHRRPLVRRWDQLHELREQGARPVGQLGGAAEQGEQLAFRHARLHRRDRLVAPDLLAAQVALEQRIVRFGDALDQLLGIAFKPVPVLGRHVHLIVLAGLRALLVHVALLREEVDDPVELGTFADRDLHRDHLGCEPLFDLTVDLLEVGVLLVHQRDEEQPRDRPLLAIVPHLFGAHLHAARGGDHHDRSVRRVHARERLPREVEIARRVDQVELRVHPLGDRDGEIDGILAFDFVGGVIGESGTVLHGSVALARAGHEREGVDQGGLSARAVAHDRHVADLRCLVHAHGRMQLLLGVRRIWSTKQQAG